MRSPFYYFRRHQKILLAVFGVALMIVFTVGSIALQYLDHSGQGRVDESTVVTFKDGSLNEVQMDNLRYHHNLVMAYLNTLMENASRAGGRPGAGMIRPGDSDRELVQTHLLAQQARDMGIVISDDAVIGFLAELTDNKIPTPRFGQILQQRFGDRMTEELLFSLLREELAAKSVEELMLSSLAAQPSGGPMQFVLEPSRAWEYFSRLNRQLTAEMVSVQVEDFVGEVPEPSAQQVAEFFEKYKDQMSFPNDPEPGFKQPRKIAVAFVQADYNKFLEEEKTKITDEQIEAFYNENREDYRKAELPPERDDAAGGDADADPDDADSDDAGAADDANAAGGGQDGEDVKPADMKPEDTEEKDAGGAESDSTATDAAAPEGDAEPAPKSEGTDSSSPAAGSPAEDAPSDEPTPETPAPSESEAETPATAAEDAGGAPATEAAAPGTDDGGDTTESPATQEKEPAEDPAGSESDDETSSSRWLDSDDGRLFVAFDDTAEESREETSEADRSSEAELPAVEAAPAEPAADVPDPAESTGDAEDGETGADAPASDAPADSNPPSGEDPADGDTSAEAAPAADPTQPAGADTDSPADTDAPAATKDPAEPKSVAESDASAEPGSADAEGEPKTEGEPSAEEPAGTDASESPKPVEYRPLEEVRDQILRSLAGQPAQERLDVGLDTVRGVLDDYYQEMARWEALRTDEPDAPQPELPDLEALAEKHGLTIGATPDEVDYFQFEKEEIGSATDTNYRIERGPDGALMPRAQTTRLANEAFTDGMPLYRAKRFPSKTRGPNMFPGGSSDIQYVYWKTAETEEFVPELDDVREEVIKAWKLREAVKLARLSAERMADEARKNGVSLVGEFGKDDVIETDEFTFYDRASVSAAREGRGMMQVSQIDGVEGIGREFMEAVFDLSAGDIGVALNQPQTTYFVVRVKTDKPNAEDLRQRFLSRLTFGAQAGVPDEVKMMALTSIVEFRQSWLEDFEKELNVEWKRDPQPGTRQGT